MGTFTNSEDPNAACSISSGSTLFVRVKKVFRQKIQSFFDNYNHTPIEMYNGLYFIKPERRIHWYT